MTDIGDMQALYAIIPGGFDFEIVNLVPQENSESHPILFSADIRVALNGPEDAAEWIKRFVELSKTQWIVKSKRSASERNSHFVFNKSFYCHHSNYRKRDNTLKGLGCRATLEVRVKKDSPNARRMDEYVRRGLRGVVKINNNHSHPLDNADALRWHRRTDETRQLFIDYFNGGMSPAEAIAYHAGQLQAKDAELLADSMVNPPKLWVYRIHDKWRKEIFDDFVETGSNNVTNAAAVENPTTSSPAMVANDGIAVPCTTVVPLPAMASEVLPSFSASLAAVAATQALPSPWASRVQISGTQVLPSTSTTCKIAPSTTTMETQHNTSAEAGGVNDASSLLLLQEKFQQFMTVLHDNTSDTALMSLAARTAGLLDKQQTAGQAHAFLQGLLCCGSIIRGNMIRTSKVTKIRRRRRKPWQLKVTMKP